MQAEVCVDSDSTSVPLINIRTRAREMMQKNAYEEKPQLVCRGGRLALRRHVWRHVNVWSKQVKSTNSSFNGRKNDKGKSSNTHNQRQDKKKKDLPSDLPTYLHAAVPRT